MFYTLSVNALPEPVKALLTLVGFALVLWLVSFIKKKTSPKHKAVDESVIAPEPAAVPKGVTLIGTDERTAAVVMAVVGKNLGIPPEKLHFISIRCLPGTLSLENISDTDAAVIMAVTSHKTGIPLKNLSFSRIALITE